MSNIKMQCIDHASTFVDTPVISSGNMNYDTITFNFCPNWDGFIKTAVFYRNPDEVYYQLLDDADTCEIPNEVLDTEGVFYVGVFGNLDDQTITSEILSYKIRKGAVTEDLIPSDPTPEIYEQIVSRYNHYDERLAYFENRFNSSVGDAEKLGGQMPDYYATAQSVTNITNGTTPVAKATNADTAENSNALGGKSSREYANVAPSSALSSSVKEKALSLPTGVYFYFLNGGSYTGGDMPDNNVAWAYSTAMITKRGATSIEITLFPESIPKIAITTYDGISWSEWGIEVIQADLTLALAGYLKNTGGAIGNSTQSSTVLTILSNSLSRFTLSNDKKSIWFQVDENGVFRFRNDTISDDIITVDENNKNTFNGTATKNLPLTGGTVTGLTTVQGASDTPFYVKNAVEGATGIYLGFKLADKTLGWIGYRNNQISAYNPNNGTTETILREGNYTDYALPLSGGTAKSVNFGEALTILRNAGSSSSALTFKNADGVLGYLGVNHENKPIFADADKLQNELLHAGNSAKVVVSETPLTAEGSVRVW